MSLSGRWVSRLPFDLLWLLSTWPTFEFEVFPPDHSSPPKLETSLSSSMAAFGSNLTHYAPVASNVNNLSFALNGAGAPGIYNSSQVPDNLYGIYNWRVGNLIWYSVLLMSLLAGATCLMRERGSTSAWTGSTPFNT